MRSVGTRMRPMRSPTFSILTLRSRASRTWSSRLEATRRTNQFFVMVAIVYGFQSGRLPPFFMAAQNSKDMHPLKETAEAFIHQPEDHGQDKRHEDHDPGRGDDLPAG